MNRTIVTGVVLVLAAGCAGGGGAAEAPRSTPSKVASHSPTPSPTPSVVSATDAQQIVQALIAAGLPAKVALVFNESNDPNNLLGRPRGYASKTAFTDARIKAQPGDELGSVDGGGSVEFFATPEVARKRMEYIIRLQGADPIYGNEYDYVNGPALLRVTGRLTPTAANAYEAAFANLLVKAG